MNFELITSEGFYTSAIKIYEVTEYNQLILKSQMMSTESIYFGKIFLERR